MIKILLNMLLSIILGKLKPVLLDTITKVDATMISDASKRDVVFNNFKDALSVAGKDIRDSVLNLVIEAGLQILKDKLK